MKLLLFALLSQALLCASVFSQTTQTAQKSTDSSQKIVSSLDTFIGKLYKHLDAAEPNKNLFFSSYSIVVAFYLLSLGAKSNTHQQIFEGLSLDTSVIAEEDIKKGFQDLLQDTNQHSTSIQLNTTNACFIDEKLKPLKKFLDDLKLFESEVISTDFEKTEEAKDKINKYVEEKTNGLIKELLDSLDSDTKLALVNIIYFKGTWKDIFNKNHTHEEDFHVDEKTVVKVPMMSRDGVYPVAFLPKIGCTVVEVPYKGNVSAIFIIPDEGKLKDVEKAFQEGSLKTWMKELKPMRISLSIPKFTTSVTVDLTEVLPELGIKDAFSDNADLSGITGSRNFKVSKATHKAVVSVDEEGTEAAAVTAIGISVLSLPPQVKANVPFLMSIVDKNTNVHLFTGRIKNPKE
ncbi:alpha-1-antiproteinase 2-like [Hyla sarda]|uniref:alpha-1-antiproteinase 2-like n=1 Tax=Hyla sarda TaxID=327740 RepID=UPI0024C2DF10|nr:alpha-1-antiproteinase 2-like [Hyla sarda]XP_056403184.1 alpha-1-antiproteinase 2-like [Hyla sarda]